MNVPIEHQIILATGEDFSALTLTAVLHQLREYGQVAIQMQGGKVPGIATAVHGMVTDLYALCDDGTVLFKGNATYDKGGGWKVIMKGKNEDRAAAGGR